MTAIGSGVGNRVVPCGDGQFCCYIDNSTNCCSNTSNGFYLGVATVVTTITGPSTTPATTNSRTSAPPVAVSIQAYPCPDLDGTSHTDATGSSYKIQCSTDYAGNDLPAVHTDTFDGCLRACDTYVPEPSEASNASCIGVTWGVGNPGGNCYLKYQITNIKTDNGGLSSGYYVNHTLPKSAVTSQGSNPSITNAPATSSTHSASGSDSPSQGSSPLIANALATSSTHSASGSDSPSQGSSPLIANALATSSTHSASDSDSHVAVGVGVGVGVPVGLAIVAGFFYIMRRQSKTRPEELLGMHAMANDKYDGTLREPWAERRLDELPAENNPRELSDPRGPRAELSEIRGYRAEIG